MQIPYRKPGKDSQVKNDPLMTKDKLLELERKLVRLKEKQPFAAQEVARLAELGDFSENAEYQQAKARLRSINFGILKLEAQINQAEIIEKKSDGSIGLGNDVIVEVNGKIKKYRILGSTQTDPTKGVISHLSPIGSALIGRTAGDMVEVKTQSGVSVYKIIEVS